MSGGSPCHDKASKAFKFHRLPDLPDMLGGWIFEFAHQGGDDDQHQEHGARGEGGDRRVHAQRLHRRFTRYKGEKHRKKQADDRKGKQKIEIASRDKFLHTTVVEGEG